MIFKIYFFLESAGLTAIVILLAVFIKEYTDASELEIGAMYSILPVSQILTKPALCMLADRSGDYRKYLLYYLWIYLIGYIPFVIIPFFGPDLYDNHPRICWYTFVVFKTIGAIGLGATSPIVNSVAINYGKLKNTEFCTYMKWGTISWGIFGLIIGYVNDVYFLPKFVPAFLVLSGATLLEIFLIWLIPNEVFALAHLNSDDIVAIKDKTSEMRILTDPEIYERMKLKFYSIFKLKCTTDNQSTFGKQVAIKKKEVNFKTQFLILKKLVQSEKMILVYLVLAILNGISTAMLGFFFIYLSKFCIDDCNFSRLAGYLQSVPAICELFFFMTMTQFRKFTGNINMLGIFSIYLAFRFGFYAFFFNYVDPHLSILIESLQGPAWGAISVILVEKANKFSQLTEQILPQLSNTGLIDGYEKKELVSVVTSTMQAIYHSAMNGVGHASGSLLAGFISDRISFEFLWFILSIMFATLSILLLVGNCIYGSRSSSRRSEEDMSRPDVKCATSIVEFAKT